MRKLLEFLSGQAVYQKVDLMFEEGNERRFRHKAEKLGVGDVFNDALRHFRAMGADKASFRAYLSASKHTPR